MSAIWDEFDRLTYVIKEILLDLNIQAKSLNQDQ